MIVWAHYFLSWLFFVAKATRCRRIILFLNKLKPCNSAINVKLPISVWNLRFTFHFMMFPRLSAVFVQFDDPSRQTRYRRSLKNDFFRSFAKETSETGDATSELSDLLLLDVHIHGAFALSRVCTGCSVVVLDCSFCLKRCKQRGTGLVVNNYVLWSGIA